MFRGPDESHIWYARRNLAYGDSYVNDALYEMSVKPPSKPFRHCKQAYYALTAAMVTLRDARVNIDNIEHDPKTARKLKKELDKLQDKVNRASNAFVRDCL